MEEITHLKRRHGNEVGETGCSQAEFERDAKCAKLSDSNGQSETNDEVAADTDSVERNQELKSAAEVLDSKVLDPLAYTKAEGFTSEVFKIQIHNLPKCGFRDLKKRLASLGLKPHKFKSPHPDVTYVCFRNEEDRQEALKKLNGHVWKKNTLEAKEAAPAADPFLQKKQQQRDSQTGDADSMVSAQSEPLTPEEAQRRLKDSVVPLWNMDYPKQLETKTKKMTEVLKSLTHKPFVREQFRQMASWREDGMPCPLLPITPSPVSSEYRNKNEFTIGYSTDGTTVKVGFRYGMYKHGTTTVGDCTGIGVLKPAAVPVIKSFEKFLSTSRWLPFLQQTGAGHWHTLTVRTLQSGDIMAMVDFHPRKLDKSEIEEAKNSVIEFYTNGEGKDVHIDSFYFRLHGKGPEGVPRLEKIFGEPHVYESLLGLKFRISPEAFFQVNTQATESLYKLVGDWCQVSENTTVLDLCCGTGTIGLSMAKRVKQVIGVEMCQQAIDDAKANASLNDVTNVRYFCSKVEDVSIGNVLSSPPPPTSSGSAVTLPQTSSSETATTETMTSKTEVVAVVDPPRAGLHKNVVKMLRKTEDIMRLVYVSCNPESATENFIDLIRPSTGKHRGRPFTLEQAVPVDLFPGTRHCELVLLFTRSPLSTSQEQ